MLVIDLLVRPALVADLAARVGGRMTEASDPAVRDARARHTRKKAERNFIMVERQLFCFMTCCEDASAFCFGSLLPA